MDEGVPLAIKGNSLRDVEDASPHINVETITSENEPKIKVDEAHTPEKATAPESQPQPSSLRIYRILSEEVRTRFNEFKKSSDEQNVGTRENNCGAKCVN